MKSLVAYYSRTGNTRFVAKEIADFLDANEEEVVDNTNRMGVIGWLRSGIEAYLEVSAEIEKLRYSPSEHDLVLLGSPVWGKRIAPAMRTYLNTSDFSECDVAFFNTNGSDEEQNTFSAMRDLLNGKEPIGELVLSNVLENKDRAERKITDWCAEITSSVEK